LFTPAGPQALCHHGRGGYQPFPLVLNPDDVVVYKAQRQHKNVDRRWQSSPTPPTISGLTRKMFLLALGDTHPGNRLVFIFI
jgi:hypothetical protein